ncbi:MFS general substrate transporter [Thelephora terrestris]|uniref:MFS general substrate transporter n=1 Tax=Thelephora terrestris TaxID=56493 RepID=A0A9P6LBE6_9AGAM|nr:MFS general substrate transporter [Thelephora terrestris]
MQTPPASSASSVTLQEDSPAKWSSDPGCGGDCISVSDESTALLSNPDVVESQVPKLVGITPIPKLQLATVCLLRLLEPIGITQPFPYINEMVVNLGILDDPSKVGFVSGLVESVYSAFQLMSIYHWAKLSNTIGRRPVLLLGALGMGLMTFLFGFSRNLPSMLIVRSLHGFFAGNIAVTQSVLGEISDSTNQAIIMPIWGFFWPLGTIVGPILGGTLSNAAEKFPILDVPLLRKFPYAMPGLVASACSLLGVTLAYFLLEETRPSEGKKTQKLPHEAKSYGSIPAALTAAPLAPLQLFAIPSLRWLIISGFALAFVSSAFDTVFVLFAYTPIDVGGLSFDASQIGYALSIAGFAYCFAQLVIAPILLQRFNCAKMYHVCMAFWFLPYAILPFLNFILRHGRDESGEVLPQARAMVWSGIVVAMFVSRVASLAFGFSIILAKEQAPNPSSLGATNGLIQMSMSLARSISPAFADSAFAASVEGNILGGHMWVILLAGISCVGSLASARVVKDCARKY